MNVRRGFCCMRARPPAPPPGSGSGLGRLSLDPVPPASHPRRPGGCGSVLRSFLRPTYLPEVTLASSPSAGPSGLESCIPHLLPPLPSDFRPLLRPPFQADSQPHLPPRLRTCGYFCSLPCKYVCLQTCSPPSSLTCIHPRALTCSLTCRQTCGPIRGQMCSLTCGATRL